MFSNSIDKEINTEILATFLFILISAVYILAKFGVSQLLDTLFLWMFPASIMIFLTLLMAKIIERTYRRGINTLKKPKRYLKIGEN